MMLWEWGLREIAHHLLVARYEAQLEFCDALDRLFA